MAFTVTWQGHGTFTLDIDGTAIVLDPYFDNNPSAVVKADSVDADYILVSHGHGDHIADAAPKLLAGSTANMVLKRHTRSTLAAALITLLATSNSL